MSYGYVAHMSAALTTAFSASESRAKRFASSKAVWDNQEYRDRVSAAVRAAMNTTKSRSRRSNSSVDIYIYHLGEKIQKLSI